VLTSSTITGAPGTPPPGALGGFRVSTLGVEVVTSDASPDARRVTS
jgi:hypothetical protein